MPCRIAAIKCTIAEVQLKHALCKPWCLQQPATGCFSFTSNQAALAGAKFAAVGVYGERRFMLEETSLYGLALALPTKNLGNFGVMVNYSGFSNFNENKAGLAYARSLGSKVDIGIQFNYYGYRIHLRKYIFHKF